MDEETRKKSLRAAMLDGSFYSVMAGTVENFIAPFALSLRATAGQIGLISSLPQFLGALFQLKSGDAVDTIKKRRPVILACVLIQLLSIIPLFVVPLLTKNVLFIILFYTLYFISGQFAGPPWNSLIGDLVKPDERGRYFGARNQVMGLVTFVTLAAAGFTLNVFKTTDIFIGFGILFFAAGMARVMSYYFLTQMNEPEYDVAKTDQFSFFEFIARAKESNYVHFVLFIGVMRICVNFAGPYFAVYMLRDLNFSPMQYALITMISAIMSFLTMRYWGGFCDKFGNRKIFAITSFSIAAVPVLWAAWHNFYYLVVVEVFSGFAWAGFNLSISNYILDAVTPKKRARCTAYYNFFVGLGNLIGALSGALFITFLPRLIFISNLPLIFVMSGLARLVVAAIFIYRIREVREVCQIDGRELFWNVVAVKPIEGLIYEGVSIVHSVEKLGSETIGRIEEIEKKIIKKNKKP